MVSLTHLVMALWYLLQTTGKSASWRNSDVHSELLEENSLHSPLESILLFSIKFLDLKKKMFPNGHMDGRTWQLRKELQKGQAEKTLSSFAAGNSLCSQQPREDELWV